MPHRNTCQRLSVSPYRRRARLLIADRRTRSAERRCQGAREQSNNAGEPIDREFDRLRSLEILYFPWVLSLSVLNLTQACPALHAWGLDLRMRRATAPAFAEPPVSAGEAPDSYCESAERFWTLGEEIFNGPMLDYGYHGLILRRLARSISAHLNSPFRRVP